MGDNGKDLNGTDFFNDGSGKGTCFHEQRLAPDACGELDGAQQRPLPDLPDDRGNRHGHAATPPSRRC